TPARSPLENTATGLLDSTTVPVMSPGIPVLAMLTTSQALICTVISSPGAAIGIPIMSEAVVVPGPILSSVPSWVPTIAAEERSGMPGGTGSGAIEIGLAVG